jgi:hypothetical protein
MGSHFSFTFPLSTPTSPSYSSPRWCAHPCLSSPASCVLEAMHKMTLVTAGCILALAGVSFSASIEAPFKVNGIVGSVSGIHSALLLLSARGLSDSRVPRPATANERALPASDQAESCATNASGQNCCCSTGSININNNHCSCSDGSSCQCAAPPSPPPPSCTPKGQCEPFKGSCCNGWHTTAACPATFHRCN